MKKGEVVLGKGRRVRVQDVGRLLSLGIPKVWVRAKPRVALLRTGSELVGAGRGGRVQDSHGPVFHGLLMALGCDPVDSGVVEDDRGLITKRARLALGKSDFVIAMGGTSAGKRDFVWAAVSRLRPEVGFRGVRMDRGRVTGFAVVKGKPVLMMPGPIQGAMNAFVVLGMPTIELLSGGELPVQVVTARMTKAWKARERFATFTKVAYVRLREDGAAEPILGETESMSVLTGADGFVVVPENVTAIQAGEDVRVRLVPGFSFA